MGLLQCIELLKLEGTKNVLQLLDLLFSMAVDILNDLFFPLGFEVYSLRYP